MLNSDGQSPCTCKANQVTVSQDSIEAGNFSKAHPDGSGELLKQIYQYGAREIAKSLQLVHDLALYQSAVPIDRAEKDSLYYVIFLAKLLRQVENT